MKPSYFITNQTSSFDSEREIGEIPRALAIKLTVNFIDLARAALSLPETTTSQPLAPDSMMNRRTP